MISLRIKLISRLKIKFYLIHFLINYKLQIINILRYQEAQINPTYLIHIINLILQIQLNLNPTLIMHQLR